MLRRLALIALLAAPVPAYAANTFLLYQQAVSGFGIRLTNDPNNAGNGVNNNIICDAGGTAALCATVTAAGALKVDGSAVTQPVSGTVAATESGTWTVQPGNTANTTAWKVDGSAVTQPISAANMPPSRGVASTNASSTVTVTNTFQQIFAASARGGCAVQNNDVNNMWVFFGTTGSATKATSVIIPPGGAINCNNGTAVLIDAVQITGTATGPFYANQN